MFLARWGQHFKFLVLQKAFLGRWATDARTFLAALGILLYGVLRIASNMVKAAV